MYRFVSFSSAQLPFSQSIRNFAVVRDISCTIATGILSILLLAVTATAQSTDASITGSINDPQGAALPGVTITARNESTGAVRSVVTSSDGSYRVSALIPGTYTVKVEREGFASSEIKGVELTVGLEYRNDVALHTGEVAQTISVSAAQALIETDSSQTGTAVVTQKQIDSLPIPGRQVTQLSLLLPGTGTDSTRAQRPNANVGTGSVSVAATNYLVDGLTNMISGQGDPRDNVPQAAVQEFKVILAQTPAEYGGRSGGVVSLVTKSGGNVVHGEAFEFFRNYSINRVDRYSQAAHDANPTGNPIAPFARNQFGGAIGGPILKNRLHYFGSFERLDDRQYFTVNTGQSQFYRALEGTFRGGSQQNNYFGRIDGQINEKQNLFLRFYEQNPSVFYCLGCTGGASAAFSSGDTGVIGWTWAAGHSWVISPRIVNQFSAQVAQSFQSSLLSTFNTPDRYRTTGGSAVYNFPSLKYGFYPGTQFHAFYQEAVEALSISSGNHTFKLGGSGLNVPRKQSGSSSPLGVWTFRNDIAFNPNDPNFDWSTLKNAQPTRYTSTFPSIPYTDYNVMYAVYAQDEWKVRRNITLNVGVRYDLQTKVWRNSLYQGLYPKPLPFVDFKSRGDRNNFAPRLGVVWDPLGNGKTVIRAGYGIVYTMNQNTNFGSEVTTLRQTSISISNPTYPDPYNGKGYQAYLSTAPANININANNISNPPVTTYTLGVSRQLATDLVLHADGIYTHITQMPVIVQINTADPVTKVRPLPEWGQINQTQPIGTYGYRALYLRLDKRNSHHYQYMLSYTLAKQNNNFNDAGRITDVYHPEYDLGPSPADRRHMFVASGSTDLKYGFTVGGIWTLRSTLPFSAITGTDLNNDGQTTDYVPGTTKNTGNRNLDLATVNAWRATQSTSNTTYGPISASRIQSSRYNQLDMRIVKQFDFGERYHLQLIGQLFNVFGTDNLGGVGSSHQTNALSNSFGQILTALPRQQGELAARFRF